MDYVKCVQKAVDYIEEHLNRDLTLEEIANQAGFSAFHFHRIFQSMLGDSVKEYIRKRRLSHAAYELFHTDRRILDIALDYHFESQESFTRAFKKMFTVTPGEFRKNKDSYQTLFAKTSKMILTEDQIFHLTGGITMEPKFIKKGEFQVIGLKAHSKDANDFGYLWDSFEPHIPKIENRANPRVFYGLIEPTGVNVEFNYYACVEVTKVDSLPEGLSATRVPANEYAVFTHKGSVDKIGSTWQYIYGTWFPKSGYKRAEGCDLELYDDDRFFGPMNPESEVDIYIPIKR